MLSILQIISALATVGIGVLALIKPKSIYKFTGLKAIGSRGITEIRSIFGALFIALGIGVILLGQYLLLGVIYLSIAIVRAVSMYLIDKSSSESSNIISFVSELLMGVILIL
jgi:hypothetical protein